MTASARETTPLENQIKERIRRDGPISVAEYMRTCLHDPEHGYYRRARAIGAQGDFITAPEISQVFGELIGLWCAVVWQQMGAPAQLNVVELGPGRGTLMRDALRATRVVPGFREALSVHLVDSSETLRDLQRATLADSGVAMAWHDDVEALGNSQAIGAAPTIVIANEFLDALPIRQFIYRDVAWHERTVTLDQGSFCFGIGKALQVAAPSSRSPTSGDILEMCDGYRDVAETLAARARSAPLAALFIDYGHAATGFGETLQAVWEQKYVSPFDRPGQADLSAQVDFEHFATVCTEFGLTREAPIAQADFLGRLGVVERASRLMGANPSRAGALETQVARLLAPTGMGSRFLAMGVRSAGVAPLPGFSG